MDMKTTPPNMDVKRVTSFTIEGHDISVTFAEKRNSAVCGQIKQILLSSFTNNVSNTRKVDMVRSA